MNWTKWKAGLIVAAISGLLTGLIALSADIPWKSAVVLVIVNTAKDALLYLKAHPVEQALEPVAPAKP